MSKWTRGLLVCALAYAVALAASVAVGWAVSPNEPWWVIGAADLAGTVAIFAFSFLFKNSSLYDAYWSAAPPVIGAYLIAVVAVPEVDTVRQALAMTLVCAWGARLTWNWARGWGGLDHEDWRYVDLQRKTGRWWWLVSFSGIHLFPTIMVYLGCLPLIIALGTGTRPLGWLDAVAALVTATGVLLEATADQQLRRFVQTNTDPQRFLTSGLWAYCRHPNYLGEILFWWGLFLFALAADPTAWWTAIGALSITELFVFISIPMIDQRMVTRRPAYAKHMAQAYALIPLKRRS